MRRRRGRGRRDVCFSSRRRHTRFGCDWSSDVCSSDLRQWQELLHGGRYSESYTAALPDFVKLADAFGAAGRRVERPDELDDAILQMLEEPRAVILDVVVDQAENCFPMIPAGAAHNEMLLGPADKAQQPVSEEGMVLV